MSILKNERWEGSWWEGNFNVTAERVKYDSKVMWIGELTDLWLSSCHYLILLPWKTYQSHFKTLFWTSIKGKSFGKGSLKITVHYASVLWISCIDWTCCSVLRSWHDGWEHDTWTTQKKSIYERVTRTNHFRASRRVIQVHYAKTGSNGQWKWYWRWLIFFWRWVLTLWKCVDDIWIEAENHYWADCWRGWV